MGIQPIVNEQQVLLPLPNFPATVWGFTFASIPSLDSEFESYTSKVELLKEEVKEMLMQSTRDITENIEFINLLCRLGVYYHFDTEIDQQLDHIFVSLPDLLQCNDYDLYILALLFRVLRQHGYKMSAAKYVFKKFKDSNGEFNKSICSDAKGLLALYEATFLSVHGEEILDEALAFTTQHLETIAEKSCPHFAEHIKAALFRPFHHSGERMEVMQFIPFYERDESKNETLLKFAKLDFNRLQLLYRKELSILSRWWKELNLIEKLPYARDRIVECFNWTLFFQFEPQYSSTRIMATKYAKVVSLLDDTFDSYGTINDLEKFTAAFERCSIDAIDNLPEYMQVLYKYVLNVFAETENDENEEIRNRTSHAKEMVKEIVRCYLVESKWVSEGTVPTFEKYVKIGSTTSSIDVNLSGLRIRMVDILIGQNEYQWMESKPKIIQAAKFIGRLMNDILPHEVERKKAQGCTLGVQSHMREHDISEEEAIEEIKKMFVNKWKDINEDCMKPTVVSRTLLKHYLSLARAMDFSYRHVDFYTHSIHMKDKLSALFLEPLPM